MLQEYINSYRLFVYRSLCLFMCQYVCLVVYGSLCPPINLPICLGKLGYSLHYSRSILVLIY